MELVVEDAVRSRPDVNAAVAAATEYLRSRAERHVPFLTNIKADWKLVRPAGDQIRLALADDEDAVSGTWPTEDMSLPVVRNLWVLETFGDFLRVKSDKQRLKVLDSLDRLDEVTANAG